MRYYKAILKIDDEASDLDEEGIETALEDTLEFLPYDLTGKVVQVEQTDEDF